jgi:SnoaL-like domain
MKSSHGIEDVLNRVAALEAEHAVRKVITQYMTLGDVPAMHFDPQAVQTLFTDEAIWEGRGVPYRAKFGCLKGHASIADMLRSYLPPNVHFMMNLHFLTSETIEVNGASANGRWIMLQTSMYANGTAEMISARLDVDFTCVAEDNIWRMSHFRTERLWSAPTMINAIVKS